MNASVQNFVDAAIQAAAEVYGVSPDSITGERGCANDSWARQVAMYVTIEMGRMGSRAAAPYFRRQPSTLRFARSLVAQRVSIYPQDMECVSRVARLALDRAPIAPGCRAQRLAPDDSRFVKNLTDVLTDPKYASEVLALREGRSCITYGPCGALALHPFKGKP